MGTSKFAGKQGSICGQIWIPYRDQFAPLRAEIPLLETVGGCPSPVLSKDLNNPSQSKNNIRNGTKKHPLRVKPIMDKKKYPYGFPGIYIYRQSSHGKASKPSGREDLSFELKLLVSLIGCLATATFPVLDLLKHPIKQGETQ